MRMNAKKRQIRSWLAMPHDFLAPPSGKKISDIRGVEATRFDGDIYGGEGDED